MAALVIDTSATLAWLFGEDKQSQWISRLISDHSLAAPWLWRLEVVNAVLVQEQRKTITQSQGTRFLHLLESLDVETMAEPPERDLEKLALLARPHQLTAYDAVYLELAMTLGLPLCSMDRNLKHAAKRLGVKLIQDSDKGDPS